MNEEKPSVATSTSTAPPPAYTSGPTHNPSQYPPQYGNPPQQQHKVTVVTTVPVRQPEVWISSRGAVPPPDRGRIVIGGEARYRYGQLTSTNYTYADELPCLANGMLVCIVCCFFVLSPISLVCSVSAYYFIKKANDKANVQNDIPAARSAYRCFNFSLCGLAFWFGFVLVLTIALGLLGGLGF